ncbi:MAG: hypothetical protein A7316_07900 [Candidatus Altiarchaeales archaeon WOR_SM1_86-2]|nr:MAG: hypothetical protein A7316_07900 [Candidatus Altiarchaeales archaeon WOR_SM1_86-2]ODS39961.1 MAG: hypothetical protein A7315_02780 [Candidatus Altiarchaeales archaeon WOR_SM1_79]
MKIRWLGHSCIEIVGNKHILIDPDYLADPMPDLDCICITHGHRDHIGRVAELEAGKVIASPDVCEIARSEGVKDERIIEAKPGDKIESIGVLKGYSPTGFFPEFVGKLIGAGSDLPGGTPLAFIIEDELSILHLGDGLKVDAKPRVDVLCLPYMKFMTKNAIKLANDIDPEYIVPIHFDTPWSIDLEKIRESVNSEVIIPKEFVELKI